MSKKLSGGHDIELNGEPEVLAIKIWSGLMGIIAKYLPGLSLRTETPLGRFSRIGIWDILGRFFPACELSKLLSE